MKTYLDWSAYKDAGMGDAYADIPKHGDSWAKAVAVCINSRQCESNGTGVMCPSYRVSKHPNLSTGGRVKLLKAALDEGQQALFDPELAEAMDLCVGCKGCKRECENNVDMALIKAEYLAQHRAKHGLSLRSLLLGHMSRWLYYAPWMRGLIRLRNRSAFLARMGQRLLGFSADIVLPEPVKEPFKTAACGPQANASEPVSDKDVADKNVVLFVDAFNRYFEPGVPQAAMRVLESAGYSVIEAAPSKGGRPLCCGRSYFAQGMIKEARGEAERLVNALLPYCEAGKTIIGLDAASVTHIREDMSTLGLGEKAQIVARQILLLEEFIAREIKAGHFKPEFSRPEGKTLIHGHCQQKAMGAMKSMRRVLKAVPGHDFDMVQSSCCGMAGSFGLEAEHREMSVKMAEDNLLPMLRKEPHERLIANGFSCRHQLRHSSEENPQHLAVFLEQMLKI